MKRIMQLVVVYWFAVALYWLGVYQMLMTLIAALTALGVAFMFYNRVKELPK